MLSSVLFAGDPLLEAIAADRDRISRTQHPNDPAVGKVQTALLVHDPTCLPAHGADGVYGDETAAAVARFKVEILGVPPESVIDDVGPQTVLRLDAILAEQPPGTAPVVRQAMRDAIRQVLTDAESATVRTLLLEIGQDDGLRPPELAGIMGALIAP